VSVELVVVPLNGELPWPPDLLVREEDTFLVLGPDAAAAAPAEDLGSLTRAVADFEPREPGSVVARGGEPPVLAAVVHDLDRDPTWRPEWVDAALREVMREADARGAASLALPVLGGVHGEVGPYRFLRGLTEALRSVDPWALERVCVRFPADLDPRDARGMERLWREG
jgi:hypothetical protein